MFAGRIRINGGDRCSAKSYLSLFGCFICSLSEEPRDEDDYTMTLRLKIKAILLIIRYDYKENSKLEL